MKYLNRLTILLCTLVTLLGYQNCSQPGALTVGQNPEYVAGTAAGSPVAPPTITPPSPSSPSLTLEAAPYLANEGDSSILKIHSANVARVSYACKQKYGAQVVKSGTVNVGESQVSLGITQDVSCAAYADDLLASTDITVNCGNRLKTADGKCIDFACKSFVQLNPKVIADRGILEVPARTVDGVCYSMKLLSSIPLGSSRLTPDIDLDVYSRNHDSGGTPNDIHHPYSLGRSVVDFKILGARTIKVSGADNDYSPILVDNFILTAIHPKDAVVPDSVYKAYGTSDSTIRDTNGVQLRTEIIPLIPFATGGTSAITALNLTSFVESNLAYTLDFRALDCGGARQLSDIYLVFQ